MGRSTCCDKNGLKKGPWTPEEDQKLIDYIQKHGYGRWRTLPKNAGLQRCGKSCRLRWTNYLRPDIKRGSFSFEEDETIIQVHSILGNKWSAIAARLPGRTDNEIKNYWNTNIRKRLLRMGIDPVTHAPRVDLSAMLSLNLLQQPSSLISPQLLLRFATSLLSHQHQNQEPNFIHMNNNNNNNNSQQPHYDHSTFVSSSSVIQYNAVQELPDQPAALSFTTGDDYLQTANYGECSPENNFSFQSGCGLSNISTPSHAAYNNGGVYSSSSNTTVEDDREISYASSILDFKIPDILDVINDFM